MARACDPGRQLAPKMKIALGPNLARTFDLLRALGHERYSV